MALPAYKEQYNQLQSEHSNTVLSETQEGRTQLKGVTTPTQMETLKRVSELLISFEYACKPIISPFRELSIGSYTKTLLRIMNCLYGLKHANKAKVQFYTGQGARHITKAINWLCENGYAKMYIQVRPVNAIGRHQRVKCYVLTEKGKEVLLEVLTRVALGKKGKV